MWRGRNREGAVRQVSFSRLGFRPCRAHTATALASGAVCRITEIAFFVGLLPPARASSFTHTVASPRRYSNRGLTANLFALFCLKKTTPVVENGPELALGHGERGGGERGNGPR